MKNIKYFFQYLLIKTFFIIFKTIGYSRASNLGMFIGKNFGPFFKSKKIINQNIKNYDPNLNEESIKKITKIMWGNYGRIFAEYMFIKDFRNNPKEFQEGIPDITKIGPVGAMTLEMAKFYFAVAAVDFTHCVLKNDSTQCKAFMDSLKDPAGHVGFALFMKTNHMTIEYAHIISRGKINPALASYLDQRDIRANSLNQGSPLWYNSDTSLILWDIPEHKYVKPDIFINRDKNSIYVPSSIDFKM